MVGAEVGGIPGVVWWVVGVENSWIWAIVGSLGVGFVVLCVGAIETIWPCSPVGSVMISPMSNWELCVAQRCFRGGGGPWWGSRAVGVPWAMALTSLRMMSASSRSASCMNRCRISMMIGRVHV